MTQEVEVDIIVFSFHCQHKAHLLLEQSVSYSSANMAVCTKIAVS